MSLQGKLKKAKPETLLKLKNSLVSKGIIFPLFVWHDAENKINWLIDGVHRVMCLRELRDTGYEVEPVPVVLVQAKNKREAKKFILLASSHYSIITKKGFNTFIEKLNLDDFVGDLNFEEIRLQFHIPVDEDQEIDNKTVQFIYSKTELEELLGNIQVLRNKYELEKDTDIILKALAQAKESA